MSVAGQRQEILKRHMRGVAFGPYQKSVQFVRKRDIIARVCSEVGFGQRLRAFCLFSVGAAASLVFSGLFAGCSTAAYYTQLAGGEYALLSARQPIASLLRSPRTPASLKASLRLAWNARTFASDHLDLPRNQSYRDYVNLHRKFAVWNVFATRPFSVTPITHCFPIAGCVAYLGYFSRKGADREASTLHANGDDVAIYGVPTFSTLGWFNDPILSTMFRWGHLNLVGEIFHELAHQKIYVPGDTRFNESYADFVERTGLAQWLKHLGQPPSISMAVRRADEFAELMLVARARLRKLYAHKLPVDMLRARKATVFVWLHLRYRNLRDGPWHGYSGYDHFFRHRLNNASLVPFALYDQWVPGFARLYQNSDCDWPKFFNAVDKLAVAPKSRRDRLIRHLTHTELIAANYDPNLSSRTPGSADACQSFGTERSSCCSSSQIISGRSHYGIQRERRGICSEYRSGH